MAGPVRRCPDHGYCEDEECPVCGAIGENVIDGKRRTRLSKFASGALRHFPVDVGLSLDEQGWVGYDAFVEAVTSRYEWAEPEHVEATVVTDPKGRFEYLDGRVRAAYGHSVDVELDAPETPVPDRLYHGTAPESVKTIREEGLRPMGRRRVHLSETVAEAREVGRRRTDEPAVFEVDAAAMAAAGERIVRRGEGIYTTDRVPPGYLSLRTGDGP